MAVEILCCNDKSANVVESNVFYSLGSQNTKVVALAETKLKAKKQETNSKLFLTQTNLISFAGLNHRLLKSRN